MNCFENLNIKALKDSFDNNVEGLSETQQRDLGKKLALDYHKTLFNSLNELKSDLKLPQDTYAPIYEASKVEKVKTEYKKLIEDKKKEIANRENEKQKQINKTLTTPKPLKKAIQGDTVIADGKQYTIAQSLIAINGQEKQYVLEDVNGEKAARTYGLSELSAPVVEKKQSKQEEVQDAEKAVVEGVQRTQTRDGIENIMKTVFNLPEIQAAAVASIYDRVAKTFASRFNTTVQAFYDTLGFKQSKMEDLATDSLFQTGYSSYNELGGVPKELLPSQFDEDIKNQMTQAGMNINQKLILSRGDVTFKDGSFIRITMAKQGSKAQIANITTSNELRGDAVRGHFLQTLKNWLQQNNEIKEISGKRTSGKTIGSFIKINSDVINSSDAKFQIIGKKGAKKLDKVSLGYLETAKTLEKDGESANNIYLMTGWQKGVDNKWKMDLPTDNFKLNYWPKALFDTMREVQKKGNALTLDSVIEYPELFKAYPQLAEMTVELEDGENTAGSLIWKKDIDNNKKYFGVLSLNPKHLKTEEDMLDTLSHEIQHAIQGIEKFAALGIGTDVNESNVNAYTISANEVEARNASRRRSINDFEKGEVPISYTEDTARVDQTNTKSFLPRGYDILFQKTNSITKQKILDKLENSLNTKKQMLDFVNFVEERLMDSGNYKVSNVIFDSYDTFKALKESLNNESIDASEALDSLLTARGVKMIMGLLVEKNILTKAETEIISSDLVGQFSEKNTVGNAKNDLTKANIFLNQKQNTVARAAVQIAADGKAIIHAITNPNVSSPLHELAHIWENYLNDKERKTVLDWSENKEWTIDTSEKFARGFEKYLAEGSANDFNLQIIFDRFKQWLTDIYKGIFGSEIDVKLNDQMRKVYSDMLGTNFAERTQAELNAELDTRSNVQKLVDKAAEDMKKGTDFTVPTSVDSLTYWSHVSAIQQAFIKKKYDKLLLDGKINEEALNQIIISTQTGEGGLSLDLPKQAIFRVNNPALIENANYWVSYPERTSPSFDDYQRTVREIATDGSLLSALNNNIVSPKEAEKILVTAGQIAPNIYTRIKELIAEQTKNNINAEEIAAKAAEERAKLQFGSIENISSSKTQNNGEDKKANDAQTERGQEGLLNVVGNTAPDTGAVNFKNKQLKNESENNNNNNSNPEKLLEGVRETGNQDQRGQDGQQLQKEVAGSTLVKENETEVQPAPVLKNFNADEFKESLMLKIKRVTADSTDNYVKILHDIVKRKDINEFKEVMKEIAEQANDPYSRAGVVGIYSEYIVKEAEELYPDAKVEGPDLMEMLRKSEEGLSDDEAENFEDKNLERKDIVQGDLVSVDGSNATVDEIVYGKTPDENMFILSNGTIAYQDQLEKVYNEQNQYDELLNKYNNTPSAIFRSIEDEFNNNNLSREQSVTSIDIKKEVNGEKKNIPEANKSAVAKKIEDIINKGKTNKNSALEIFNNIKNAGYVFNIKEGDSILNYLKDFVQEKTEYAFTRYVNNTGYRLAGQDDVESKKDEDLSYLGLKTILERLNTKFGGKIPYQILKNNESFTARIKDGVVQINLAKFDKTTPFHEYLHPFMRVLQEDNRELYNNLVFELKSLKEGSDLIDYVKSLPFYANSTRNEIEEEALIRYMAKQAAENVDSKGRRIEAKYQSKMSRLIARFREWFTNLWKGGGMTMSVEDIKSMPLTTTMEDIADLFSLHDLRIDLSEKMHVVSQLEAYQDEVNPIERTIEGNVLKKVKDKLGILDHTARTRLSNDVLVKELIGLRTILKDTDEISSIASYLTQATQGLTFANETFLAIKHKLHAAEGTMTQEDIQQMGSDLQVVKTFIALYEDAKPYFKSTFSKDMPDEEYREYSRTFDKTEATVNSMMNTSIDLLTEYLYPYVERNNEKIKDKHPNDVVSKEKFKNSLYSADGDVSAAFYNLGSVSSSKDVVSAVTRAAIFNIVEENHLYETTVLEEIKIKYSKFLTQTGLKNEHKPTEDFYKRNFLRRVTLNLQKGMDENNEPIMKDSQHWAFIQEFNHDLYDKARSEYMNTIAYDPTNQDTINKLRKWQENNSQLREVTEKGKENIYDPATKKDIFNELGVKIGEDGKKIGEKDIEFKVQKSFPSNAYRNDNYDSIKDNELYKTLMEHYNETNEKLGDAKLQYGVVPQVSKGKGMFADYKDKSFKEQFAIGAGKVANFFLPKVDETTTDEHGINLDGTKYYGINNTYNKILEEEDLNLTLPETVLKFASSNNLVSLKKAADPTVQVLKDAISGNSKFGIDARKINKVTTNGKMIWDRWSKKPADVEVQKKLLNKQLIEFINDAMYGESSFEAKMNVLGRPVSLNKIGANMGFLTALNNMAFNVNGAINNSLMGNAQIFIESTGGRYFNKTDFAKATSEYVSNMNNFIKDGFDLKKSKVTQMGIKYDAIQGEFRDKFGKSFVGNMTSRYANGDTWFILNHAAEHQIQLTGMLSLMNATKVKTNDGTTISLFDAHVINKDGFLRLRDDIAWSKQDDIDFTTKWHAINKRLNGNYSAFDKSVLQRRWYGKLVLMYRKFIYESFKNRFAGEYVDYELGNKDFGYQRKFFGKLYSDIKEYKFDAVRRFYSKDGWNEDEKYAFNKTITEFSMLGAMAIMAFAIAKAEAGDDKDDNVTKAMLLYTTRFRNDLAMFTILGLPDVVRILKNPSAVMVTATKYVDFFGQLVTDPTGVYSRKTGPFEKGDYKLKAKLFKAMPVVRQYINFVSPAEQLAYYNVLSKKSN